MEYNRIMAITGLPGLFELLSSKTDGAIVRSLDDKTTKFVSSRVHNFSHLESIEVYTTRENVNLVDVFKAIEKDGGALPSEKDNNAIKSYFQKVYPDMDFERVYTSDMKKMVKWYSVLKANDVEIKLTEYAEDAAETEEATDAPAATKKAKAEVADTATEEAPKKAKAKKADDAETAEEKAPAKKAAAKKVAAKDADEAGAEDKPKKTARKKKTEE